MIEQSRALQLVEVTEQGIKRGFRGLQRTYGPLTDYK